MGIYADNHTIALLSPATLDHFKEELEELYKPNYIFDSTRSVINNYYDSNENSLKIFQSNKPAVTIINKEIKILLNTSGTTSSPKFVKLSENNLVSNAQSISDYLPISGNDVAPF